MKVEDIGKWSECLKRKRETPVMVWEGMNVGE